MKTMYKLLLVFVCIALLAFSGCAKTGEEPTPSPTSPVEETQEPVLTETKRISVSPAAGNGRQLILECPADWESDGHNYIDYQGRKLVEISYCSKPDEKEHLQKMNDVQVKQLGNWEFFTYSEEYGILEGPELVPGVEEKKVYLYTIWIYYFFDGEDGYRIALFENQEREQVVSIEDFENILANLEIEQPSESTGNAVGYEKMELGGFSLWLPEGTVYRENTIYDDDSDLPRTIAKVGGFEAIEDKEAPFAVYDEKYSDAKYTGDHEFCGYPAKSYHRQWEENTGGMTGYVNVVEYCIATEDGMLVVTFYPARGIGGIGNQCEEFEKILRSIQF